MANHLRAYVRRTILTAAVDYSTGKRRTEDSTKAAFIDAMSGTASGWWNDLIYTAPMLAMAHRYRRDIAAALADYRDATGESYVWRDKYEEINAEQILSALMTRRPYDFGNYLAEYDEQNAALLGLRFAVEWNAGELARQYAPSL